MSDATVGLAMIVKNESHIIRRALASVLPWIDAWTICDTGSVDGTQAIIREALAGKPGTLHQVPWVNFGYNRTQALHLARESGTDYTLILDADLVLRVADMHYRDGLSADGYEIRYDGDLDYVNLRLVSNKIEWEYIGVTHEYLQAKQTVVIEPLPGVSLIDMSDGGNRVDKFERDIRLLTEALKTDPDNPRSVFYLAQSYKDLGRWGEALAWYAQRTEMLGFDEERFYAAYMKAHAMQQIGVKWSQVEAAYLDAFRMRPHRLEPIYPLVKHYRERGDFAAGLLFGELCGPAPSYPITDRLFIDRPVYQYLLPSEVYLCAKNLGRKTEALRAAQHIRKCSNVPKTTLDLLGWPVS